MDIIFDRSAFNCIKSIIPGISFYIQMIKKMKDLIVFLIGLILALLAIFTFSAGLKVWGIETPIPFP
ncbi:hypothetical protein [Vandammella animalimorsus]|uniref:hypothetical protein n=1 Tax=Vandammella animalimorsus TaxID=2029117 RepID=UPI0011C43472|nr:hypothetical protein [Vandammella animalimorsus]